MSIEILHRYTKAVLYRSETANTVGEAVKAALRLSLRADLTGADLTGASLAVANLADADLTGANLTGANLTGANLTGANLAGANLADADLTGASLAVANLADADLTGASLTGANLAVANLADADLTGADLAVANLADADLTGANLTGASLTGADLTDADLTGADLTGANLTDAERDLCAVLCFAPREVPALIAALESGKINGSVYSDGQCGCLIGTLSIAAGSDPASNVQCSAVHGLDGDAGRPIERLFTGIKKGDTPKNNQVAKLVHGWASAWHERMKAAFSQ